MSIVLRDYQQAGANEMRAAFADGVQSVLYALPTGGGKTAVFTYIAVNANARGNEVLILVHRKELLRQASLSLGKLTLRHGIIAPADKVSGILHSHVEQLARPFIDQGARVMVASVQTLGRRLKQYADRFKLVIVDEAHHATAGTWRSVIEAMPSARIIGVTATPCRSDGQGLGKDVGGIFERLVLGPSMRELVDDGYLVQTKVYGPPVQADTSSLHKRAGDYVRSELANAFNQPHVTGDAIDHYRRIASGRPAIAFCCDVKHAETVAAEFRAAGIRSACVHGEMDDDERDRLITGLGKVVDVLTSADLISEGTDTVAAEVAILLRKTESLSLFLQQVGRVMRPIYAPGFDLQTREGRLAAIAAGPKPFALVLDHAGNCGTVVDGEFMPKHGLPDADREWTLEGVKKGSRAANDNEPEIRVMQCPKCYATHEPMPYCPACGHNYEVKARKIKQAEGELQEITAEQASIERARIRQQKAMAINQCKSLSELQAMAKEWGYDTGWAWHRWQLLKTKRGRAA